MVKNDPGGIECGGGWIGGKKSGNVEEWARRTRILHIPGRSHILK